jgi:hypothetical protein
MESYGRPGQLAMAPLHRLEDEAAGPGGFSRTSLVAGTLRLLSAGVCRGNFLFYRGSVGVLARVSGSHFCAGAECGHGRPCSL